MKRCDTIVFTLLCAVLLALPARAYPDSVFACLPCEGADTALETVVTDTQGRTHRLSGAPDLTALEDFAPQAARIDSYAVTYGGAELLSVTLHDFEACCRPASAGADDGGATPADGWCTLSFPLDSEAYPNCEVFLTGLGADAASEVQAMLTGAAAGYRSFELDRLSFIDAEKLSTAKAGDETYSDDSELCWAASASNLLLYTGWAAKAGMDGDEDDLLDLFEASFGDGPGSVRYGLTWFFNGSFYPDETQEALFEDWAHRKPGASEGNFLPKYPASFYVDKLSLEREPENIREAARRLRDGWGAAISVGWYELQDGVYARVGGHAITVWGYIREADEDALDFDKNHYRALLTSDSDSDPTKMGEPPSGDRRTAPDKLHIMPLEAACVDARDTETEVRQVDAWWAETLKPDGLLEEFIVLKPYSDEYPEDNGTFDPENDPNWLLSDVYISDCEEDLPFREGVRRVFAAGGAFSVTPFFGNGGAPYPGSGQIPYKAYLRRDDGAFAELGGGAGMLLNGGIYNTTKVALGALEPGDYTLRLEITDDIALPEAYFTDNTLETGFTVTADAADLSGAALHADALFPIRDDGTADIPLSVTGMDEALPDMDGCFATVAYWGRTQDPFTGEVSEGWSHLDCTAGPLPGDVPAARAFFGAEIGEPFDRETDRFYDKLRVRVLFRPGDDAAPWPALETELNISEYYMLDQDEAAWQPVALEDGDVLPYFYFQYDLLTRTILLLSQYPDYPVYAAGYDRDGRMVFFSGSTFDESGAALVLKPFPEDVRTLKLFWLDFWYDANGSRLNVVPKCEAFTIQ